MLPAISLREVNREDVVRIARWLGDDEVVSRWFGYYACGDPIHRGYEPSYMMNATGAEGERIFRLDPQRLIFSICTEDGEHIGECQEILDGEGGAELTILIGRKDLWHKGYGTSAVLALLDEVFNYYGLDRAWVNVPEDNAQALGLFKKLGFRHQEARELCKRKDGTSVRTCILEIGSRDFEAQKVRYKPGGTASAVTVAGLPGSGSTLVGEEVARIIGSEFVDDLIPLRLSYMLGCTVPELQAFQESYRSVLSRIANGLGVGIERYGYFAGGGYGPVATWSPIPVYEPEKYISKERYLQGLRAVARELAGGGDVVLHGNGLCLAMPQDAPAFHVLVMSSEARRSETMAATRPGASEDWRRILSQADRDTCAIVRSLYDCDLLDLENYDLVVNVDRLGLESASRTVARALVEAGWTTRHGVETPAL